MVGRRKAGKRGWAYRKANNEINGKKRKSAEAKNLLKSTLRQGQGPFMLSMKAKRTNQKELKIKNTGENYNEKNRDGLFSSRSQ
ncbi:MAG: hypothetical protein N3G18_06575 [Candidatus Saccharicenans sp.]|nr:hypothetical protein [Candidatus Saccharicenans sp.]